MSRAKKCDRCGNYYDLYDHDIEIIKSAVLHEYIDLCPRCHEDLKDWLSIYKVKECISTGQISQRA